MQAKVKCSNCGAEITNLNFSWGKKQWLMILPALLVIPIALFPLYRLNFMAGDIAKDLEVSGVEKRVRGPNIEVVGVITNNSKRAWQGVNVEAEFFDANGKFIDEERPFLSLDMIPGAKEHFKITIHSNDPKLNENEAKVVVKITSGRTSPF
jgi:hypothetical protein